MHTKIFYLTSILLITLLITPCYSQQSITEIVKKLEQDVAKLKEDVSKLKNQNPQGIPGPRGETGEPGPMGPRGYKGEKGDPGIKLSNISFEQGITRYYNQNSKLISIIGNSSGNSGFLRFFNNKGNIIEYLGGTSDQNGSLFIYDSTGKEVVEISAYARGGGVVINGKSVHDFAEVFELAGREGIVPGTVMSVSESGAKLSPSNSPYDKNVVGVISGAGGYSPGMRIGTREDGTRDFPIAICGQVYVRVCLEGGSIKTGDILVSSSNRGVAMKARDDSAALGSVIGKALESYSSKDAESEGLIRMLVMNR